MPPSVPPSGPPPGSPPPKPSGPSEPVKPVSDGKDAFLLQSPFAKMFAQTGVQPTVKEMRAIINGILKMQIDQIKREDKSWKEAMKKLKKALEGND